MRVALINPRLDFPKSNIRALYELFEKLPGLEDLSKRWLSPSPGTGLLILAAMTPDQCELEYIDENTRAIDFSQSYDLVGLTGVTAQAPRVYRIADQFRENGAAVVIGGIHATILPEEAKQHADSVVIGEGEYLWPHIVRDAIKGDLKPFYRASGPIDMNDSPIPKYECLKPCRYSFISVQTSRGCPHNCDYCVATAVYGRKYRHKAVDRVLAEVTYIKERVGWKHIFFSDDNLLVRREHAKVLLRELSPLKIRWTSQSDIAIGDDPELLALMRDSGCAVVEIGLESLSTDTLRDIDRDGWKLRQRAHYAEYVNRIQEHGIGVVANFMVGFDTDDITVFDDIQEFVIENNLLAAFIGILCPLPGSRLRKAWEDEGREMSKDWSEYNLANVTFAPKRISKEALEGRYVKLYETIYSDEVSRKRANYFTRCMVRIKEKEMGNKLVCSSISVGQECCPASKDRTRPDLVRPEIALD
jgi:radical SAM superfamily enzyme YgiQ (UPF0313 family)